jgi:hypothetical protein
MKIAKSFGIVIIIIAIISCKKSSNTTTGNSGSSPVTTYGYFSLTNQYQVNYPFSSNFSCWACNANVYFLNNPNGIVSSLNSYYRLGGLSLNGVNLTSSGGNTYFSGDVSTVLNQPVWKITGSGNVPSFTFTDTDTMPGFTGFNLFPDTIKRSQNLVLQINGISHFEGGVSIQINDAASTPNIITIPITNPAINNTVTIPSYSLSSLVASSTSSVSTLDGSIALYITGKPTQHTIGSCVCTFTNTSFISNSVYIK